MKGAWGLARGGGGERAFRGAVAKRGHEHSIHGRREPKARAGAFQLIVTIHGSQTRGGGTLKLRGLFVGTIKYSSVWLPC